MKQIISKCYNQYNIASFPDSDYSFAFNLAKTDEVFQHARDPMGKGVTSYLHDMQRYKQTDINAYRLLDPRDTYPAYPGNQYLALSVFKRKNKCLYIFATQNNFLNLLS